MNSNVSNCPQVVLGPTSHPQNPLAPPK